MVKAQLACPCGLGLLLREEAGPQAWDVGQKPRAGGPASPVRTAAAERQHMVGLHGHPPRARFSPTLGGVGGHGLPLARKDALCQRTGSQPGLPSSQSGSGAEPTPSECGRREGTAQPRPPPSPGNTRITVTPGRVRAPQPTLSSTRFRRAPMVLLPRSLLFSMG